MLAAFERRVKMSTIKQSSKKTIVLSFVACAVFAFALSAPRAAQSSTHTIAYAGCVPGLSNSYACPIQGGAEADGNPVTQDITKAFFDFTATNAQVFAELHINKLSYTGSYYTDYVRFRQPVVSSFPWTFDYTVYASNVKAASSPYDYLWLSFIGVQNATLIGAATF
jgi:hypothetical protein